MVKATVGARLAGPGAQHPRAHSADRPRPALFVGAVVVALLVLASGCLALNPARHVRSTGEALYADTRGYRQGDEQIDEQDFYELAGDRDAVRRIRARRRALLGDQRDGQAVQRKPAC
jgi:hypothetical protein